MCSGLTLGAVGIAVKEQARTPKSLVLWFMVSTAQLVPRVWTVTGSPVLRENTADHLAHI